MKINEAGIVEITQEGLALMTAEIEAQDRQIQALKMQLNARPDPKPFGWSDMLIAAGVGATLSTIGLFIFWTTL